MDEKVAEQIKEDKNEGPEEQGGESLPASSSNFRSWSSLCVSETQQPAAS